VVPDEHDLRAKSPSRFGFKVRLGYSPDDADAFVLTFAQPVAAGMGMGTGHEAACPRARGV